MINFGILTISDKCSRGERYDGSGAAIQDRVALMDGRVVRYDVIPDEIDIIRRRLIEWADAGDVDVILTTGGTGLGLRDFTPEATLPILDKLVPGIAEAMRLETFGKTPSAILSRAVAGVRKKCLIINLPGSTNGVRECLEVILTTLVHAMEMITGEVTEHSPEAHKS
ncbi:MAG: MogA/MoaB family molybdenum cofactor biosynthesis protein [Dehalococcoidales bacterium]|nr:MogA/MoaB family molybdenum cofactor biosynthesis protein [Dehalococcoidales bacterium]